MSYNVVGVRHRRSLPTISYVTSVLYDVVGQTYDVVGWQESRCGCSELVPPYPYCIEEDRHDVALEDCWTARPQLFFSCHLRPKDGRLPETREGRKGDRA